MLSRETLCVLSLSRSYLLFCFSSDKYISSRLPVTFRRDILPQMRSAGVAPASPPVLVCRQNSHGPRHHYGTLAVWVLSFLQRDGRTRGGLHGTLNLCTVHYLSVVSAAELQVQIHHCRKQCDDVTECAGDVCRLLVSASLCGAWLCLHSTVLRIRGSDMAYYQLLYHFTPRTVSPCRGTDLYCHVFWCEFSILN